MKRFYISIITLAILLVGGFTVWRFIENRANAEKLEAEILKRLTAEEITEVLKSEATADRNAIKSLGENAEKRQLFLKGIKETLALAAQARHEGFANKENFKTNLEYKKKILIADLYQVKLSKGKDKLYIVPEEQIKAVWKNPEHERLFQKDMKVMRQIRIVAQKDKGNNNEIPELQGDALGKARKKWASTKILSEMAQKDVEFITQKAIPLRIKIIEAGILANDYMLKVVQSKINATEKQISEYLKKHPEYDVTKKLEKAEMVLAKVKAGENFEELVKEFSEDRASIERDGIYKDIKTNVVWKEVEEVALKLDEGEVAEKLIESNLGFHIVKLVKKNNFKKDDKSDLKFSIQHIVLQKKFEEPEKKIPGIPKPFLMPQEIAKAEVEKEKRNILIGEIIKQNPISLPEDFAIVLPEIEKNQNSKQRMKNK